MSSLQSTSHLLPIQELFPHNAPPLHLAGREQLARPLREHLLSQITEHSGTTVLLDFTGIDALTLAVAEELGPVLHQLFVQRRSADTHLAYQGLHPGLLHALNCTFDACEAPVAVAFDQQKQFHVLGSMPHSLLHVLERVYQTGGCTAQTLASEGVVSASKKLHDLWTLCPWTVVRERQEAVLDGEGWCYRYLPVWKEA